MMFLPAVTAAGGGAAAGGGIGSAIGGFLLGAGKAAAAGAASGLASGLASKAHQYVAGVPGGEAGYVAQARLADAQAGRQHYTQGQGRAFSHAERMQANELASRERIAGMNLRASAASAALNAQIARERMSVDRDIANGQRYPFFWTPRDQNLDFTPAPQASPGYSDLWESPDIAP